MQQYLVDPKEAKLMQWHAERVKPDEYTFVFGKLPI
jgi:hypothetical protein